MSMILGIQNGTAIYYPVVLEEVKWDTERYGAAGKLTFKVAGDAALKIAEGNLVVFTWNGENVFQGFIFTISEDKEGILTITAYDQLRYFKNKDTYLIEGKSAGEVLQMIAADFNLQCGVIDDVGYKITSLVEDNKSLFDIIQDCLDETLMNAGELYVLFDDFGKLSLRNISNLKKNILVDRETAQNRDFSTSIDSDVYNRIKLVYDNQETGQRDVYIAQDGDHINKWGILQQYDKLQEGENGQVRADAMLKLYNQPTRTLTVKNVIGSVTIRAGVLLPVTLELYSETVNSMMLVESCKHTFKDSEHWMDLTIRGGNIG